MTTGHHAPELDVRGTVAGGVPSDLMGAAQAFLHHGSSDQVIPFDQGTGLRDDWCARGGRVRLAFYATDQVGGVGSGNAEVLAFVRSLMTGQPVQTTCN